MKLPVPPAGRRLSGLERVWLVAHRMAPPFSIDLVLEGEGDADPERWAAAVEETAAVQPGCRLSLRGGLGWTRWKVGEKRPRVRVHSGEWDGLGPEGAPFLLGDLDPRNGPIAEVWLVPSEREARVRVVFRILHAAMDGRGLLGWATDVLRVVNGRAPVGAVAGPTTDHDLATTLGAKPEVPPPRRFRAPTGESAGRHSGPTWARVRVQGLPNAVLPRVVDGLFRASRQFTDGPLRIDVPVDLRRHVPELVSSANLTGICGVELEDRQTLAEIRDSLSREVAAGTHGGPPLSAAGLRWIPISWMSAIGRAGARQGFATDRYQTSATVSNVGSVDVASMSGDLFRVDRTFFVPPSNPGLPLLLVVTGCPGGLDLCGVGPGPLVTEGRLQVLLEDVARGLVT